MLLIIARVLILMLGVEVCRIGWTLVFSGLMNSKKDK